MCPSVSILKTCNIKFCSSMIIFFSIRLPVLFHSICGTFLIQACGQIVDKAILPASGLWAKLSEGIRSSVSEQTFATWFEPIRAVALEETTLTLEVPSKFYYEWIDKHYREMLLTKIKASTGKEIKVRYSIVTVSYTHLTLPTSDLV